VGGSWLHHPLRNSGNQEQRIKNQEYQLEEQAQRLEQQDTLLPAR
jgi:hypothetical protein